MRFSDMLFVFLSGKGYGPNGESITDFNIPLVFAGNLEMSCFGQWLIDDYSFEQKLPGNACREMLLKICRQKQIVQQFASNIIRFNSVIVTFTTYLKHGNINPQIPNFLVIFHRSFCGGITSPVGHN